MVWDIQNIKGNVVVADLDKVEILDVFPNTVTDAGKQRMARFLIGESITSPNNIAIGNSFSLNTESAQGFTALKSEFARTSVSNKLRSSPVTARLVSLFGSGTGTGTIREFGLFDVAESITSLNNAEATSGWSSGDGGTITLDTSDYMQGSSSLSISDITGDNTEKNYFRNTTIGVDVTSRDTTVFHQVWIYVDDINKLNGANSVKLRLGDDTSNYYVFSLDDTDFSDGWNFINKKVSDATVVGTPSMFSSGTLDFLDFGFNISSGQTPTIKIDMIRLFQKNGNLWARAEPNAAISKGIAQVVGIYWFLAFSSGADETHYKAFTSEKLTISTTAKSLTSATHSPSDEEGARQAYILVGGMPVRYFKTGDNPTNTAGFLIPPQGAFVIDSNTDIGNAKFIRDANATSNATLFVEYMR